MKYVFVIIAGAATWWYTKDVITYLIIVSFLASLDLMIQEK